MTRKTNGLGGAKSITDFVKKQIKKLRQREQNFESIYDFMFSLEDNVFAEHSEYNRITKITYGECKKSIEHVSNAVAHALKNVKKGSLVGLYFENSVEWVALFWSILKKGYVPLLMNRRLPQQVLLDVIRENSVAAVISDGQDFDGTLNLDGAALFDTDESPTDDDWADEIVFMTSGTSLSVKLCVYNGKRICEQIYNTEYIISKNRYMKQSYDGEIKILTFLPFYHVFGFLACYMWFAFFARTFVFLGSYSGDTILKTVRLHKVTHVFAVPLLWTKIESGAKAIIAERGEETEKKFNKAIALTEKLGALSGVFSRLAFREVREKLFGESISFMISGGGAIPERTLRFFNGLGYRLSNGFGMTEIGITSVQLSKSHKKLNSASVGIPFPSVTYETDNGELTVKGTSLAVAVIRDGARHEIKENETFRTGDLAEQKNGEWFIKGRADDLIVTASGENIAPDITESHIDLGAHQFALIGLPDKNGATRSVLIVSPDGSMNAEKRRKITEKITLDLGRHSLLGTVDDIRFTKSRLLSENEFKTNRKRIKNSVLSGDIQLISPDEPDTEQSEEVSDTGLFYEITELFGKVLKRELTKADAALNFFYDLGGDSLSYFELCEEVKKRYGVNPIGGETVIYSINDMYSLIEAHSANTVK